MIGCDVVIVEDEALARAGLRQLVDARGDCRVVGEAADGNAACRVMLATRPQIVLLDVEMPDMDGFAALQAARAAGLDPMPAIVFITAFDNYAVEAFRAHAVDYVVKPFTDERFTEALDRACAAVRDVATTPARLVIRTDDRVLVLDPDDIDWVEADSYYAKLHVGRDVHLVRESLTAFESRLGGEGFIRVHRSALVSVDRIREVTRSDILLSTGARVPLARDRRRAILARIAELDRRVPL